MSEYIAEKTQGNTYQIVHLTQERVMGRYLNLREIVARDLTRTQARRFINQSTPPKVVIKDQTHG